MRKQRRDSASEKRTLPSGRPNREPFISFESTNARFKAVRIRVRFRVFRMRPTRFLLRNNRHLDTSFRVPNGIHTFRKRTTAVTANDIPRRRRFNRCSVYIPITRNRPPAHCPRDKKKRWSDSRRCFFFSFVQRKRNNLFARDFSSRR